MLVMERQAVRFAMLEFSPSPTPPPEPKNLHENHGASAYVVFLEGKVVTSTCNRSLRHLKKPMIF